MTDPGPAIRLLESLRDWDALNPPTVFPYGDAPYFKSEIERVLRLYEESLPDIES